MIQGKFDMIQGTLDMIQRTLCMIRGTFGCVLQHQYDDTSMWYVKHAMFSNCVRRRDTSEIT